MFPFLLLFAGLILFLGAGFYHFFSGWHRSKISELKEMARYEAESQAIADLCALQEQHAYGRTMPLELRCCKCDEVKPLGHNFIDPYGGEKRGWCWECFKRDSEPQLETQRRAKELFDRFEESVAVRRETVELIPDLSALVHVESLDETKAYNTYKLVERVRKITR